uniref:tRNA-uridine aminocarboxypropyltransferase 1 n=1 Tax=Mus spicilegus TaxID=10103 RepID=A0A8C6GIQ8_MUSSI
MALSPSVVPQESKEDNANCVETKPSQTASIASEDPLQNLCLASQEVLRKAQQSGRSRCRQCGGSRMFYCYTCCVPVGNVPTEQIPCVQLPLKIDIIKHPNETDGKSTAVHAKLLAPDSVNIYTYPCIPEYEGKDHEVVLVFPGPQSISIEDVSFHLQKRIESKGRNKADNLDVPPRKARRTTDEEGWGLHESTRQGPELKRVVFIDSTWSQTNQIASDERLRGEDGVWGLSSPHSLYLENLHFYGSLKRKVLLNARICSISHLPFCILCVFMHLCTSLVEPFQSKQ